jgi:hypothetical protein
MDSRSVAMPPPFGRTARPTIQRRYRSAIPLPEDAREPGSRRAIPVIMMADLSDHDRPIWVIMMDRFW